MRYYYRLLGVIHAIIFYLLSGLSAVWSQGATFVIEEYMVHDGIQGVAELAGHTTYRFYLQLSDPEDFVSAIYGGETAPMSLELESPMFNSPFATGSTAGGILPIVGQYFPEVLYDSWVTIGLEHAPQGGGEADVSALQSEAQPFLQNFVAGSPTDGEGFAVNDALGGAWFLLNGTSNGFAGDDLKVLVMQVTTEALPIGTLNAQVIPANPDLPAIQVQQGYEGTEVWDLLPPAAFPGCTDPAACNFDPNASEDDGSCEYGTCGGCTDVWACNFDPNATEDDGSCDYLACIGCTNPTACNYDPTAVYNDGSCEFLSCGTPGCMNPAACNYNPEATVSNGTCEFTSCVGCTDPSADNYNPAATVDNGSCAYGGCINPIACNYDPTANASDGSCEFVSCIGCMNASACNYDPSFTISDPASCEYAQAEYDCDGICLTDTDADGVCDGLEIAGCTDAAAENYNGNATDDDGSCVFAVAGCVNPLACNYNPNATQSNGSCEFSSCVGCTNPLACNYDEAYTIANNSTCVFAAQHYNCAGACLADNDGDGVCNELEILGCTDELAMNYSPLATDNNGSCIYPAVCNDPAACNYTPYEGYCLEIETYVVHTGVVGTTDLAGYVTYRIYAVCENPDDFVSAVAGDDVNPTFVHTTTQFFQHEAGGALGQLSNPLIFPFIPEAAYDSWVTIGLESDANSGDGESGVSVLEGTNPWIAPFEAGGSLVMSDDLGGVWYVLNGAANGVAGEDLKVLLGQFTTDGNLDGQMYVQFFEHGDGLNGGFNKLIGLHDACGLPTVDACEYPAAFEDCDGMCIQDEDGDGICNELEVPGCTDVSANNFNPAATDDNGSCDYSVDPCEADVIPPYFTFVPADSTVQCDQAMPTTFAVAADDCDANVQVMFIDGPIEFIFDCPPYNYLCTRTFIATDDAGNQAQAIQLITVADTLAPVILNQPADEIFVNEQAGEQVPDPFIVIQDGCDGNAQWSSVDAISTTDGDTLTYIRTYTAVDACGNSSDWAQTIVVLVAVEGCTDALACNYAPEATNDDGSCAYPEDYVDCEGQCLNDSDGDGVCDELESMGCTVSNACNFDPAATEEDGSCDYCSCADDEILSYGLEIDTVAVHTSGPLAGMTTYRFYATVLSPNDFVSAVYGNDTDTLIMSAENGWYQDEYGSHVAQAIDPAFFATFPTLEFDSWVTIGLTGPTAAGENLVNTVGQGGSSGWVAQFEGGADIVMNNAVGGSWFILNGGSNGVAGEDLRVLIAQMTTSGGMNGQLNVQIFESGDNAQASVHHFTFDGAVWTNQPGFANPCGCTDATAFNFDPTAQYDDGSCVPIITGCTDEGACNFVVEANVDDASCTYAEPGYDCDGVCNVDTDLDGVCDEFEVYGCTDSNALNFDELATEEDGSCIYCTLSATVVSADVTCAEAADGSIVVSAVGAIPDSTGYTFELLPSGIVQTDSVFTGLEGGAYVVVVSDNSGCTETITVQIAEPDPLLVLLDAVNGSIPEALEGSIAISVNGGTGPFEYNWIQLNGTFTSTEEDLTGLNPGTYVVTVTDANGCTATSFEIVVEAIVGVGEYAIPVVSMHPNPASDWLEVSCSSAVIWSQIQVFTLDGRLVWERNDASPLQHFNVPVSEWPVGHYVLTMANEIQRHQMKIQVLR